MKTYQHTAPHSSGSGRQQALIEGNLQLALHYAGGGTPVFPCDPDKRPLTAHGHHDATDEPDTNQRRWAHSPHALVGIPTGRGSGVWVVDVDGEAGRRSLNELIARLGIETIADLTPCVSRTPNNGLHLIFRSQPGERPRNRARDIGAGLDTRGVKADGTSAGYFIAPGSTLPDGRRYRLVDPTTLEPIELPTDPFGNAALAPRALLYLATFNAAERAMIAASPELRLAVRDGNASEWSAIVNEQLATQRAALAAAGVPRRPVPGTLEAERQHRYVRSILDRELPALAAMQPGSGRNDAAFRFVCRVGRWVHNDIIPRDQLIADVLDACEANGLVHDDGRKAVLDTIASGLARSAADELPELGASHG